MTPAELQVAVGDLVRSAAARRGADLTLSDDQIVLERPRSREHGDWASTVAMRVGKQIGVPPRDLAQELATELGALPGVAARRRRRPRLHQHHPRGGQRRCPRCTHRRRRGRRTARSDLLAGRSVEHGVRVGEPDRPAPPRAHPLGGARRRDLPRAPRLRGEVVDEYYINDAGTQMDHFGASVLAAARGLPTPEGGYPGEYITDLAEGARRRGPRGARSCPRSRRSRWRGTSGTGASSRRSAVPRGLQRPLRRLVQRAHAARRLRRPVPIEVAVERLRAQGRVFEADGALWLRTSEFGDDKDRVLVRSNGETTYFAADAAYYLDKRDRGYDEKVYLLGADHHGYIGRLKALAVRRRRPRHREVLIGQTVKVNGARLSKRAGNIVELVDLLDWLGSDSLRYWLARYPADTPLDLDGEQLKPAHERQPRLLRAVRPRPHPSVARNAVVAEVTREHGGATRSTPRC